ncbi:MAG: TetR/AcrR family transcriptional regulator [Deltaproteobacteria bacterium]|nr:TetR/AcrR family transcriptional regulator [Deltaproteobacteria bacterium]
MSSTRRRPVPRKRPQQERSRQTVDVILTAAERILSREGLAAVTTARVAEVAGISVGSLYQYYPNKESIFGALLERSIDRYYQVAVAALEATRSLALDVALRRIIEGLVAYFREAPRLHGALHEVVSAAGQRETYRRYLARHVEAIGAYFASRADELRRPPAIAAFVIVHAADGIGIAIATERPDDARMRELTDEVADLAIRYLVGP